MDTWTLRGLDCWFWMSIVFNTISLTPLCLSHSDPFLTTLLHHENANNMDDDSNISLFHPVCQCITQPRCLGRPKIKLAVLRAAVPCFLGLWWWSPPLRKQETFLMGLAWTRGCFLCSPVERDGYWGGKRARNRLVQGVKRHTTEDCHAGG